MNFQEKLKDLRKDKAVTAQEQKQKKKRKKKK